MHAGVLGVGERGTHKKLVGAARHWAGADAPPRAAAAVDEGVIEGLRFFGASEEDIAREAAKRQVQEQAEAEFEVYADCWDSLQAFLMVQTNWLYRTVGFGSQRVGLCRSAMESTLRMAGIPRLQWQALFADMRVMELAVLRADVEMAERNSKD